VIEVYTDGLAQPSNPGIGTYGFVVYRDGKRIKEDCAVVGENVTNNYAEYEGLVHALKYLVAYRGETIIVRSDSKLLVGQMKGEWKVKKGRYLEKYHEAVRLAERFESLEFEWIPREKNEEADRLSRIAYMRHSNPRQSWRTALESLAMREVGIGSASFTLPGLCWRSTAFFDA
jgi:ribonuclease HI